MTELLVQQQRRLLALSPGGPSSRPNNRHIVHLLFPKKQLHLDIVRSKSFLVFHDLSSEDETKVFHRSSGKLSRNGFLELEKADLRKAKNKPEDNDETL